MIYFFADNHYGAEPGRTLLAALPEALSRQMTFRCDDWTLLESGDWIADCELLILNLIGGTCGLPHPSADAERAVRRYCEAGGNLMLLHGGSAAFWQWAWWRRIVGLRWVRPGDPDGVKPSTHPVHPYSVMPTGDSPIAAKLRPISFWEDEIYTDLHEESPVRVLMETQIPEGKFPQAYESSTPWGGRVVGVLPGHRPGNVQNPDFLYDFEILLTSFGAVGSKAK